MHRSHNVNESATYFEEHPELKFDGNNSKRALISAFKNPDSWLKSLCIKRRKQELCDGVNDVAGVIDDVEEIAILVPRILTQMVERTVDVPQILTVQQPVPQVTTQSVARPYPAPQLQTVDVPVPQVMIQEVFKQVPVPVMKPVDVPVPQIMECPVPVPLAMMQDVVREVD